MAKGQRDAPKRDLEDLIQHMSSDTLSIWETEVLNLVNQFLPKKRRDLLQALERTRDRGKDIVHSRAQKASSAAELTPVQASAPAPDLSADFRSALDVLGEQHIFQWSTFYRDCLERHLTLFSRQVQQRVCDGHCRGVYNVLEEHSKDVFTRAYNYARATQHSHDDAVDKSTRGLSRFLGLPLDYYSARWSSLADHESGVALRLVVSAALSAIVSGYGSATFDKGKGDALLQAYPRSWLPLVAYMTPRNAEMAFAKLPSSTWKKTLVATVLPFLDAMQVFFDRRRDDYLLIPVASQYFPSQQRLDVGLRPPPDTRLQRVIETTVFIGRASVPLGRLTETVRRQASLVIGNLNADTWKSVQEHVELQRIVVQGKQVRAAVAEGAFHAVDRAIESRRSNPTRAAPLTYNFAGEFPLHNPGRATSYHVPRTSVRDLLRTFERRDGVRLWCSVRRSGKTTACFNLESATGESLIISQTCGSSELKGDKRFYERVTEAVSAVSMLDSTFVNDVVSECAPIDLEDKRLVLVIDEYETLFGLLDSAVQSTPNVRYTVVQPILNQLREFASNNLLVFLGQQPNAYFILMDQNQLAPYVEQDPFPLFEHLFGTTQGEFAELVNQVLRGHIDCTPSFLDALYRETAGHPYLTVNVLVELVQWLIDGRRSQRALRVRSSDFDDFSNARLNTDRIALSPQYDFFRNAAAEALSQRGYRSNPWLFAAYWTVRILSEVSPDDLRVERSDLEEIMRRIPVPAGDTAPDAPTTLRTASLANFLTYDEHWVSVKVRTLGRIAAATRPALA